MVRPALWRGFVVKVCITFVITLMVVVVAGAIWPRIINQGHPPRRYYYAAITNADLDLGRPERMTSTSFDLSLGVAAPPGRLRAWGGYCLERGTAVEASYRRLPLARAVFSSWEAVCAAWWMPPGDARWTRIVALGNNITASPGFVVDALAADARSGVREYDVTIWTADGKMAAWCGARRVGDDDTTAAACDVRYSTT